MVYLLSEVFGKLDRINAHLNYYIYVVEFSSTWVISYRRINSLPIEEVEENQIMVY